MLATLKIERVSFSASSCSIIVKTIGDAKSIDRARLSLVLLQAYPRINEHACINSCGAHFGDCMDTTSLPHVLEHCILCELAEVEKAKAEKLSGLKIAKKFSATTDNLGLKLAKIEFNYYDDIRALNAIKNAESKLNEMIANASRI